MNLVRLCIAGTGMVQISVEVNCKRMPPRLNIVDVLQPSQEDMEDNSGWLSQTFFRCFNLLPLFSVTYTPVYSADLALRFCFSGPRPLL